MERDPRWIIEQSGPPRWVMIVYAVIQWIDDHPLYLLPSSVRYWRYGFYDRYCACDLCRDRRAKGRQKPGVR